MQKTGRRSHPWRGAAIAGVGAHVSLKFIPVLKMPPLSVGIAENSLTGGRGIFVAF